MTASSLLGNEFQIQYLSTSVSPNAYTLLNAAVDFGEFGEEKPLVDITTLNSTAREYRNGLADGLEIALQMNYAEADSQWDALYNAYANDTTMYFKILVDNSSPIEGWSFAATVRGWRVNGTPGEKASSTFTLKITGAVTRL